MTAPPAAAAQADAVLAAARRQPERTLRRGHRLLRRSPPDGTAGDAIEMLHAMAVAHVERGEVVAAGARLRRGLALAQRAGNTAMAARLRLTAAWVELERSAPTACLAELAAAAPALPAPDRGRAECLRGLALHVSGRHAAAEAALRRAIAVLRRGADHHWLANAYNARGAVRLSLLRPAAAATDLARARSLFEQLREPDRAACCRHNEGYAAACASDLPAAMACFAAAESAGVAFGTHPELLLDEAHVLLAAGLTTDARRLAERATGLLAVSGRSARLGEAALAVAECALRGGDAPLAVTVAGQAARLLDGDQRPSWSVAAHAMRLRAELALPGAAAVAAAAAPRLAADCDRHGQQVLAARLRLAAAAVASPAVAAGLLAAVAPLRRSEMPECRALGWLARARLGALRGNRRQVAAAVRAGLRACRRGVPDPTAIMLAELALDTAQRHGPARSVVRWADCWRGQRLPPDTATEPDQRALADALRLLRAERPAGSAAGRAGDRRRLAERERAVRQAGLPRADAGAPQPAMPLDCDRLAAELGDTVLLDFTVHSGALLAISVAGGRFRRHRIADAARVAALVRAVRFDPSCGTRAASELDGVLLGPLRTLLADRPLVAIPCAPLDAVPWAALPCCVGRPVSVAPSAGCWLGNGPLRAMTGYGTGGQVWIAGSGPRHAAAEVRSLHARWGGLLLSTSECNIDSVLSAMDGSAVTHIAAHGAARSDQPSLSYLDLACGPLYGHDLARLRRPPGLVVVAACESGVGDDRVAGLAGVLLRRGTRAVIASTLPVPDAGTAALMAALHARLRNGQAPAAALAEAQAETGATGFVCLGRG